MPPTPCMYITESYSSLSGGALGPLMIGLITDTYVSSSYLNKLANVNIKNAEKFMTSLGIALVLLSHDAVMNGNKKDRCMRGGGEVHLPTLKTSCLLLEFQSPNF